MKKVGATPANTISIDRVVTCINESSAREFVTHTKPANNSLPPYTFSAT
jgi:hypothetical protein